MTSGWFRVAIAAAAALTMTAGARNVAAPRPPGDDAPSRDAVAVSKTIEASTRAFSEFPKTRSIESVLSFYSREFTGVENGAESDLDAQRALLEDLREQIAQGAFVGLSLQARNITVRTAGDFAWATYDYRFRIGSAGGDWDEEEGKCSSILARSGRAWRFVHEHCSSVCPDVEEPADPEDSPLRDRT